MKLNSALVYTQGRLAEPDEYAKIVVRASHDGLRQVRLGDIARIEVPPEAIARLAAHAGEISAAFKRFGFAYTTLDLQGYRTGSLNENLDDSVRMGVV